MIYLLRRRGLGRLTGRKIPRYSTHNIQEVKNWLVDVSTLEPADVIIRWGCTSTVPKKENCLIINQANAIHKVSNKGQFRIDMLNEHISTPRTVLSTTDNPGEMLPTAPFIVRPMTHNKGKNYYEFNSPAEYYHWNNPHTEFYISEKIPNIFREVRCYFANGFLLNIADKTKEDGEEVENNWGTYIRTDVPMEGWDYFLPAIREAYKAHQLSGLDISGIDVLLSGTTENYTPFICEANSSPTHRGEFRQRLLAKAIDYMIDYWTIKVYHKDSNSRLRNTVENLNSLEEYIHPIRII